MSVAAPAVETVATVERPCPAGFAVASPLGRTVLPCIHPAGHWPCTRHMAAFVQLLAGCCAGSEGVGPVSGSIEWDD